MRFRKVNASSTVQEFARLMMDGAKENLRKHGQVLPVVILLPPSKRVVIGKVTSVQKEFWPLFVRGLVQSNGGKLFVGIAS